MVQDLLYRQAQILEYRLTKIHSSASQTASSVGRESDPCGRELPARMKISPIPTPRALPAKFITLTALGQPKSFILPLDFPSSYFLPPLPHVDFFLTSSYH